MRFTRSSKHSSGKLKLDLFLRNILVLSGGSAIGQVITLGTLPIITRLYSPVDFGIFSVYTSIVAMVLLILSMTYERAIPLPESDKAASHVVMLSLGVCVIMSLVLAAAIYTLHSPLSRWMSEPDMKPYFLLIILSFLGGGFYQVLNYWSVRKAYFKPLSRTRYSQSISQVASQLLYGACISTGPMGLVLGDILGRATGVYSQWRRWRKDTENGFFSSRMGRYQGGCLPLSSVSAIL